jgi:hypothetical protein
MRVFRVTSQTRSGGGMSPGTTIGRARKPPRRRRRRRRPQRPRPPLTPTTGRWSGMNGNGSCVGRGGGRRGRGCGKSSGKSTRWRGRRSGGRPRWRSRQSRAAEPAGPATRPSSTTTLAWYMSSAPRSPHSRHRPPATSTSTTTWAVRTSAQLMRAHCLGWRGPPKAVDHVNRECRRLADGWRKLGLSGWDLAGPGAQHMAPGSVPWCRRLPGCTDPRH